MSYRSPLRQVLLSFIQLTMPTTSKNHLPSGCWYPGGQDWPWWQYCEGNISLHTTNSSTDFLANILSIQWCLRNKWTSCKSDWQKWLHIKYSWKENKRQFYLNSIRYEVTVINIKTLKIFLTKYMYIMWNMSKPWIKQNPV